MRKTMVNLVQSNPGILVVEMSGQVIGTIASGDLWEDRDGNLQYRANKKWVVIGREYQRFSTMWKAAQALCRYVRSVTEAKSELKILQSGEGFLPVFKRIPRNQRSKEVKDTARRFRERTAESKLLYHDALKHAGYSKLVY